MEMISSAYSVSQNLDPLTGVTPGVQKCLEGSKGHLHCPRRSRFIIGVVGSSNPNDTMLRRSAQLLLAAEDHHFEGSLLSIQGARRYKCERMFYLTKKCPAISALYLRSPWEACYLQSDGPPPSGGAERTAATWYHSHYHFPQLQ